MNMRRKILLIVWLICVNFINEKGFSFYYKTTSLPEPRQMYGAAVLGDFLYVVGGDSKFVVQKSVLKARILSDGSLSNWTEIGRAHV